MTIRGTLCYILKDGTTLLIRKKKGFGAGKLNAPGGKLKEGETPEQCVIREVLEETGLQLNSVDHHGSLRFYFGEKKEPDWTVYVFSSRRFTGEPEESEEASPFWVRLEEIPYEQMWKDDRHWVPLLLENKLFSGDFHFDPSGDKLVSYRLKKVKSDHGS